MCLRYVQKSSLCYINVLLGIIKDEPRQCGCLQSCSGGECASLPFQLPVIVRPRSGGSMSGVELFSTLCSSMPSTLSHLAPQYLSGTQCAILLRTRAVSVTSLRFPAIPGQGTVGKQWRLACAPVSQGSSSQRECWRL